MGLFDADGTIIGIDVNKVSVRIAQTKLYRLESIQRILHKYGIFSRIYKDRKVDGKYNFPNVKGGYKEANTSAIHELVISTSFVVKFANIFGFLDNEKKTKLEKYISGRHNFRRVQFNIKFKEKEKLEEEEVFDCTIPEINHFNVNGILSHNCSEIGLESFELCNLSEVFPYKCIENDDSKYGHISPKAEKLFVEAIEFATFYSSTVSLLPTHNPETNAVIGRNRRIGVSLSSITDIYDIIGFTELTRLCRLGYRRVREINTKLARDAGIPASLRVTTVKPSGSISQLVGVSSGMHFPTFPVAIRRMRISDISPLVNILKEAGYKWEKDGDSDNTLVFEFPINQGKTRPAQEVTIWEQFSLLTMLQREWSDNMVSVTIYFDPIKETNQIEYALAQHAPVIKSCSILPHTEKGAYKQPPYEGITIEEYNKLLANLKPINWNKYCNPQDPEAPKYCTGDTCELPPK
jgi:hypothetical protein